jgi:methanethiol S-methyltransferase
LSQFDTNAAQLALLALIWALWCGAHSLLLADFLRSRLERALRLSTPRYRLAFAAFSLLTFWPVAAYSRHLGAFAPLMAAPPWLWPQLAAWSLAVLVLLWAAWDFSRGGFDLLGLLAAFRRQPEEHRLITSGAYARMRHPMNLATLIVVWARPQRGAADLLISLLLTVYTALATWHEETRLRRQFGDAYREYAQRVGLLPFWP